jgi:alanine dehydrogenase
MEDKRQRSALLLSRKDVERVLTPSEAVRAVEDGYREVGFGTAVVPSRLSVEMSRYGGNLLVMPAYLSGSNALATKLVTTHLDNHKSGLPTVIGTIILTDPENGRPLAILDGTYLTAIRTGAAGAVGAKYLSRENASTATIAGTGVQGRAQILCLAEVRKIRKVFACDVDPERRRRFVEEMKKRVHSDFVAVDNLENAVRESDIVVTATTSSEPVIKGQWLSPGCHVTAIGSHTPSARELDEEVMKRASKIVLDTWDAKTVGDLAYPISTGVLSEDDIYSDIGTIVAGRKQGRASAGEITVFKSVGTAVADVSSAFRTYQLARLKGIGSSIDLWNLSDEM